MKIHDIINEEYQEQDIVIDMFKKFLPLAMRIIEIDTLPKIEFTIKVDDTQQPTFGRYSMTDKSLQVALANRHPNDILRTIAHELQHYKQDLSNQLDDNSGDTGSAQENEANAVAGVVMRHFNKNYPQFLSVKPVVMEKWTMKYKKSINCSAPKGFSQRAHCQGRKKRK